MPVLFSRTCSARARRRLALLMLGTALGGHDFVSTAAARADRPAISAAGGAATPVSASAAPAAPPSEPTALPSAPPSASRTLIRYPTSDGHDVVFEAHGNLWSVPLSGGPARRLTTGPGDDMMPRFSPDGRSIAFTASYGGNQDVYVMPAGGGEARRLTFHSSLPPGDPTQRRPDNLVLGWTPDGQDVVFLSHDLARSARQLRPFKVPAAGGLPVPLPFDHAGQLAFSPDGGRIAFDTTFNEFATWKRYDGGLAPAIELYDVASRAVRPVSPSRGANTAPMWVGNKLYFLSDRDEHRRANIWCTDLDTGQSRQVTHFADYDIDFPSFGGTPQAGVITFGQGGRLWAIDLPTEHLHPIDVTVPDDGTRTMPRSMKTAGQLRDKDTSQSQRPDFALSPNGGRAAFSVRGDIVTVPAENGAIRDLTRTSNADEDHPAWSPDGRTLAYTTDITGEQQLALRPAAGGPERILTRFTDGFLYAPVWSPDGRRLAVPDDEHRLWLVDAATGAARQVMQDPAAEILDPAFSPDGGWLAYSTTRSTGQHALHLFEIATGHDSVVSSPMSSDYLPRFSPDGSLLVFASDRNEVPTFSDRESDAVMVKSAGLFAATLRRDAPGPLPPRSDEGAAAAADDPGVKAPARAAGTGKAAAPFRVDLDGLMDRITPIPVEPTEIDAIAMNGSRIFYHTSPPQVVEAALPGEKTALRVYDLDARKDELVVDDVDAAILSGDGKRVLFRKDGGWHVADAKPNHPNDKTLKLSDLRMPVDPRAEWKEMFDNSWRIERDLFFSPTMNNNDWRGIHDHYARLLPLLGSRADLNYLIGQIIGELANSHTYVGGGDGGDRADLVPTPLLGVDFELDAASGRYRFAHVLRGDDSRSRYRAPLNRPGLDIRDGDFLLAVNGEDVRAPANPYAVFAGLNAGPITLTVSHDASGGTRDVVVDPVHDEIALREQDWIERNRRTVDRLSGGKVGYVYLTDMSGLGLQQFARQFFPQTDKQAMLIDERGNGGGFVDQIVLERLRRTLAGGMVNRQKYADVHPSAAQFGPKAMLIDEYAGSDGDMFPFFFRQEGLGKLVGKRTWGGVRGIRGDWGLMDGGYITIPEFASFGRDGHWILENHGVDPDVVVENAPDSERTGHDAQLEAGVKLLLDQLRNAPDAGRLAAPPPPSPAYQPSGDVPPAFLGQPGQAGSH
ncbi:S41 family peptidase [Rhizosaccharibacter radicis]|uniref:PDZ domain-containing protein n=1 Tax=Rhizosaccharibacter radicis TaxID=2782605 RepID=A0ABT1VZ59_9PROT|nr:PDZ domain-containing protein [Acetobacteraceae bacterium KSS12]